MDNQQFSLNTLFVVSGEMISEHGEDFYSYKYSTSNGFIGVFDGCGGIGARKYPEFDNYTGAFLASRATALAALDWWTNSNLSADCLKNTIVRNLSELKQQTSNNLILKGSLSQKSFPTTASIISFDFSMKCQCDCFWIGDSRGYILDDTGLAQITKDDIDGNIDAFANINTDSCLKNVINADSPFEINHRMLTLNTPALLIVATDGCFAYYETPMEFEYAILSSLLKADSISDWKNNMHDIFQEQASDDYTLAIAVYGYRSYQELQEKLKSRHTFIHNTYILPLQNYREKEISLDVEHLWDEYRRSYYRYG